MPTPIPAGITLETVMYNGPSKDKKNLLFLGDGFTDTLFDRKLFDRTIKEIEHRLFKKVPFNLRGVKKMFNIFKAYTPSPSSGISCLREIDSSGVTLDSDTVGTAGPSVGKLEEKHSALGLTYGLEARVIEAKAGDENLILNFIDTLSLAGEQASAIPDCWATPPTTMSSATGKDFGLIVVLVNDDRDAGSASDGFAALTLGASTHFNLTGTAGPRLFSHSPNSDRNDYDATTWTVLHELGHSHFNLEDEYSGAYDPAITNTKDYYTGPNAVTKADITNAAGDLDPSLIKWNKEVFPASTEKIISAAAFTFMQTNKRALWVRPANTCANLNDDPTTKYPPRSLWNSMRYPQQIIGIYEGGGQQTCGAFVPAGSCRMNDDQYSDFCYVCKHAIIEKIDPSLLEELYKKCYPRS